MDLGVPVQIARREGLLQALEAIGFVAEDPFTIIEGHQLACDCIARDTALQQGAAEEHAVCFEQRIEVIEGDGFLLHCPG